jgi:GNAT superfamily N-acetyltransferase
MMAFMEPIIRPVRAEEFTAVGELVVREYETVYDSGVGDYADALRDVADRTRTTTVLVAEVDGHLAGTVTYVPRPGPYAEGDDPDAGWIRMLAVDAAWQGRGFGAALVTACLDLARRGARRRVLLHTTDFMPTAMRLYERLGFRRAAELDWEPEPGFWLRGYAYELTRDSTT